MDKGYEMFCLVDPAFYESPVRGRTNDPDFELAQRPVPDGWARIELDEWLEYAPVGARLPAQGWKIHVSAGLDNAKAVLDVVFPYCVARRIAFKFIRSVELLLLRNAKYADRGASGKFVTIYPSDDVQLEVILNELGGVLEGHHGPYILSDLRWGSGPLYVRYGGFVERYCIGDNGEQVLAIEDSDGRLVPDRRGPTFYVPPWVTLPALLEPQLAARAADTMEGIPYRIDRVLHFSNGGGLYAGVDVRNGDAVVLKEARPHAGLALDGSDAVTRLDHEREILSRLAGLDVVPAVHDYFTVGEHHFLVQEFVDATPLHTLFVLQYPLTTETPSDAALAEYTAWAVDIDRRVASAVAAIHDRGIVICDLHPNNVLVRPDGSVVLIDFETASEVGSAHRQALADPGFVSPAKCEGFDIDRYALACLRLFLFMPLPTLVGMSRDKAKEFAAVIADTFPVAPDFLNEAVATITELASDSPRRMFGGASASLLDASTNSWTRARDSMARAILASATPERDDRLFPGDVRQFVSGGLNLAHGAAGVLYALAEADAGRFPEHEDWLVRRATDPEPGSRFGFYDGLHGVAFALDALDRRAEALKVVDICTTELSGKWDRLGLSLYSGLAGIGLNLAHFARVTADPSLLDEVWRLVDVVADRLGNETSVSEVSGGREPYAGLVRGSSGPALLFLRLYEQSDDSRLLDLAATAIRQDLRRCAYLDDGALAVNEEWRMMPYLADGSIGIGFVIDDFLRHRADERFMAAAAGVEKAARSQFFIEPALFQGRAGMILYLSRARTGGRPGLDDVIAAQIRRLKWHALSHGGHLVFPGDQLLRLSMDLATGTAGVLLALGSALHDKPVHLPFLDVPVISHTERR